MDGVESARFKVDGNALGRPLRSSPLIHPSLNERLFVLNPHALAIHQNTSTLQTDVLIVGAGPAGLFQVFELGLLGIKAHVIDPLPYAGGQCIELYADKAIYDIPALPVCTGRELIDRLLTQIKPFAPVFHFGEVVQSIDVKKDARGFTVQTQKGLRFDTQAVVLANGVGAFLPRPLNAPEQAQYLGQQLFHGDLRAALAQFKALQVQDHKQGSLRTKIWVVGGDDQAVHNALTGFLDFKHLDITLIHRRAHLDIEPEVLSRWHDALSESGASASQRAAQGEEARSTLQFKHGQIVQLFQSLEDAQNEPSGSPQTPHTSPLKALKWVDETGDMHLSEVDMIVVNLGLSPQLGPIAEWGPQMHKKQITINPEDFSTSVPGLFAIGDVITYHGKKKLILSGFHEAALASFGIAKWVFQKDRIPFEYTSASALLQSRLGVKSPSV